MDQPYNKPIPRLDDPDMAPFWAAAREHRLTAQRCSSCATLRFPGLPICPTCLERGFAWVDVSAEGSIWSYVVYHRAFHPGFAGELPYVVAIVENADGVRYTGRVVGQREDVAVGAKVRAVFADETPEFTLVQWELA
jgi:uncharacterized OB-fold protein